MEGHVEGLVLLDPLVLESFLGAHPLLWVKVDAALGKEGLEA